MTEYASRGDPQRSMALLWGLVEAPTRGPKPGLAVADIVATAVAVADAEGLGAVSMRRVADRLGKSAMSLYTYVPGKAELLDLMLDAVLGELPTEYPRDDGWRAAVEASARDGWAFYERHPWVLQVSGARALLGPHELDAYETQLRLFDGLGLTGVEMSRAVSALAGFVRGSAKAVADARSAEQATGLSDDDWWNARSPLLDEAVGDAWSKRYPTASRLAEEHAFDQLDRPDDETPYTVREALDAFEFGLQRLLDGLEALVETRR
ncbi:MAG: TetR/AcrR family transcriptional regulator C-terminal domain-containing protein [Acidimicrobiales bacterium]